MPDTNHNATPPVRRTRGLRAKLILATGGLVFALCCAEAGARLVTWMADRTRVAEWTAVRRQRIEREPGMNATLGQVIRPSEHPDVIYQLIPDLNVTFMGAQMSTNSAGFRGPEVEVTKPDGVFRILGLGDSVMFGQGVANGEQFVRVVERILNEAGLERRVEIINTAVPGYNTAMEVAILENLGWPYDPDMLWIDYVGNDMHLPDMLGGARDALALDRSQLWEWAASLLSPAGQQSEDPSRPLVHAPWRDGSFESDPERVPPEYRHIVGVDSYLRAMRKLGEIARQRGLPVLVTAHHGTQPYVHEVCEQLGVPLVRGYDPVREWMESNGVETYRGSALTVSDADPHPSVLQHRMLGEHYADFILRSGLLK